MNKNKNTKIIANPVGAGLVSARNHRGITLIALIITIIVMLILVGVSITIALKGGLFETTKKAAKGTEAEKNAEQELASGRIKIDGIWYDSLEDYAIGKQSAVQGIVDLDESNTRITYTPDGWTNGEVKVGIDASEVVAGYILKYSTDSINWNNYSGEIPMSENGSIYAKLVDNDGNEGGTVTANVTKIDKDAPTVNTDLNSTGAVETDIPLSINVTDSNSGISKIIWYYKVQTESDDKYKNVEDIYTTMNGKYDGDKTALLNKTKILTGLKDESTYNIYAEIYDVAGNKTRSPKVGTIDITTDKIIINPKVGDKIKYEPDPVSSSYSLAGTYSGNGTYSSGNPYTLSTPTNQTITQEILEWEILKIHSDGSIDIIGKPTTGIVRLGGWLGYNNGVYLLNDICKRLYSKPTKGIEARSVNIEDFENDNNGGNWKSARDSYSGYNRTNPTPLTGYASYYPVLYAKENGSGINTTVIKTNGINVSDNSSRITQTYSLANSLTATQSFYSLAIDETNYGEVAKVLSQNNEYWLASRSVIASSNQISFALSSADARLRHQYLCHSFGFAYAKGFSLRPVVTLPVSSSLNATTKATDGSPNTFEINF